MTNREALTLAAEVLRQMVDDGGPQIASRRKRTMLTSKRSPPPW